MRTSQAIQRVIERDTIPKPVGLGSRQASVKSSSSLHQVLFKLWLESACIVAGVRHGS